MTIRLFSAALLFTVLSCNTNTATDKTDNKQEQVDALNEQSKQCLRLMNTLEVDKNAAIAAGDASTAALIENRIDSAAKENVKIGQKMMELGK